MSRKSQNIIAVNRTSSAAGEILKSGKTVFSGHSAVGSHRKPDNTKLSNKDLSNRFGDRLVPPDLNFHNQDDPFNQSAISVSLNSSQISDRSYTPRLTLPGKSEITPIALKDRRISS